MILVFVMETRRSKMEKIIHKIPVAIAFFQWPTLKLKVNSKTEVFAIGHQPQRIISRSETDTN